MLFRSKRFVDAVKEMKATLDVQVQHEASAGLAAADIIITTTPSKDPLVFSHQVKPGAHINAIGADAPGKQELDSVLIKDAYIVVDDVTQASHSGEINVPLVQNIIQPDHIQATLPEIVSGLTPIQKSERVSVFDSTGLAIQDIVAGAYIFNKAKEKQVGQWIQL